MKSVKIPMLLLMLTVFLFISCQKEKSDSQFDLQVKEQSEVIADIPEILEKVNTMPIQSDKLLETSGIKGVADRTVAEEITVDLAQERRLQYIVAGQSVQGTTKGSKSNFSGRDYLNGCLDKYYAFDAPDRQFYLQVKEAGDYTIELSELSKDLDLFIFGAKSRTCYGYSVNPQQRAESISVRLNPGTYIIVVDGYNRHQIGDFKLDVYSDGPCENFDGYNLGDISPQSNKWSKWLPGATFDGQIVGDRSFSPALSLYIDYKPGHNPNDQMDVVRQVPELKTGSYLISWKMYVPKDRSAAFNFQKFNVPGVETGLVVYLKKGNGIEVKLKNQTFNSPKTYTQQTWLDVQIYYSLDNQFAVMTINGEQIARWDTRLEDNAVGLANNRIGGVNYWAYHNKTTFYLDDFCFEDYSNIAVFYPPDPDAVEIF